MAEAIEQTVLITNKRGLHARAAAKFVQLVAEYEATVEVVKDDMQVCGRSIMGLLMLGASQGTQILVRATGTDAPAASAALVKLIEDRFGEE